MARAARARRRHHFPPIAVRQLNPPSSVIHPINPTEVPTHSASSSSTTNTRTRTRTRTRNPTTTSRTRTVTTVSITRGISTKSPAFESASVTSVGGGFAPEPEPEPEQPDDELPETLSSTSTSSVAASITRSPDPESFQATPSATAGPGTLSVAPSYGGQNPANGAAPTPSSSDLPSSELSGADSTVTDTAKPETQRSADDGSPSDSPIEIAVPVAVSAFVVFIAVAALFLLRYRRRRRGNQLDGSEMAQDVGAGPATRSIGTTTHGSVVSSLFGGRRAGIPNPFADAESIHSRDSYHDETSPVVAAAATAAAARSGSAQSYHTGSSHPYATAESPFRDPDQRDESEYADSPFSDSYAAAAHHAAAMEASRFASPRLSTTPRSETPRFIFGASGSSIANTAGHSSANLSTPHLAFSAPPPPVPHMPDFDSLRSPLSVMTFGTGFSGDTMSPSLVQAFPAPPAQLTLPDPSRRDSTHGQLIDLAESPKRS